MNTAEVSELQFRAAGDLTSARFYYHADDKALFGGRGFDTYGFHNSKVGKNGIL